MAEVKWDSTLPQSGSESKGGTDNNLYIDKFEKDVSNDGKANGMGIARPSKEKNFEEFPGASQSETNKLKDREIARYDSLVASGAMGMTVPITNAGIVLDTYGGAFGEGGTKPDIQGGANK